MHAGMKRTRRYEDTTDVCTDGVNSNAYVDEMCIFRVVSMHACVNSCKCLFYTAMRVNVCTVCMHTVELGGETKIRTQGYSANALYFLRLVGFVICHTSSGPIHTDENSQTPFPYKRMPLLFLNLQGLPVVGPRPCDSMLHLSVYCT